MGEYFSKFNASVEKFGEGTKSWLASSQSSKWRGGEFLGGRKMNYLMSHRSNLSDAMRRQRREGLRLRRNNMDNFYPLSGTGASFMTNDLIKHERINVKMNYSGFERGMGKAA